MFEEELADFDNFLENNIGAEDVSEIINVAYQCFFEAITKSIYEYYSPNEYHRSFQLLRSINYKVEEGYLFVFIDTSKLNYHSVVTGENVSEDVPLFINGGHEDTSPIFNQYHHYEARNFLDKAKDMVERKLDMKVEIMS